MGKFLGFIINFLSFELDKYLLMYSWWCLEYTSIFFFWFKKFFLHPKKKRFLSNLASTLTHFSLLFQIAHIQIAAQSICLLRKLSVFFHCDITKKKFEFVHPTIIPFESAITVGSVEFCKMNSLFWLVAKIEREFALPVAIFVFFSRKISKKKFLFEPRYLQTVQPI